MRVTASQVNNHGRVLSRQRGGHSVDQAGAVWRRGYLHRVLPNCSLLNQGAAPARRGRTRSACWRPPAGAPARLCGSQNQTMPPAGTLGFWDGCHSAHRRPRQSRADLPQGAKVVRPVGRSTWTGQTRPGRAKLARRDARIGSMSSPFRSVGSETRKTSRVDLGRQRSGSGEKSGRRSCERPSPRLPETNEH